MRFHWLLTILKLCVSLTVFARGWLTWRWDSPVRGLLWQEGWWGELIDWQKFALNSDSGITTGLQTLGIVLMVSAAVPWIKWARWLLLPVTFLLIIDSFARFVDSGNHLGMAIEHTLQWGCPLLLFLALKMRELPVLLMQLASALTFVGHGLYAVGFHPVPLKYQSMTTALIDLEGEAALQFLLGAGILDFVAAAGLFFAPIRRFALLYMIGWGAATAFARVLTGGSIDPWLMETIVRSSHWMVPIVLLTLAKKRTYE